MALRILIFSLAVCTALPGQSNGPSSPVRPGQRILLLGDSITKGYGFGTYTNPSPLNRLYDLAKVLLDDNVPEAPPVIRINCGWEGFNEDGTKIGAVDSLAGEMKYCIDRGEMKPGDWLIYEDAGQVDMFIHPWPLSLKKAIYSQYRQALGEMIRAASGAISRDHFNVMTMFDYGPKCKWCQWDAPLDDGVHTGNDVFRDTAAELGVRLIDMNAIMDAANDHTVSKGWGRMVGPDGIHPNVYGNYVMVLALLNELGYDVAQWKLDSVERRFRHPEAGGDVPEIWGFQKDPSDAERIVLLRELRRITVETARSSRKKSCGDQPPLNPPVKSSTEAERNCPVLPRARSSPPAAKISRPADSSSTHMDPDGREPSGL
jgi:hypothetical protein